jgi:serine protease Do
MKKIIFVTLALGFVGLSLTAIAQQESTVNPENQKEVIIRSKGDKNVSLKVDINGDDVTINGKPLVEFKDDNVSVNIRKMRIHEGDHMMTFDIEGPEGMSELMAPDKLNGINRREFSSRPFLGVTTEKATDGARIVEIAKGSAAEKAGLKKDDIITKIDGQKVADAEVLADIIAEKKPKSEIKISYKREGKNKEVSAVLGEKTEDKMMTFSYKTPRPDIRYFKGPHPQITPMPDGNMLYDNPNMEDFDVAPFENFGDFFPRQKKLGLKIQDTEMGGNVKVIEVADSSAAQKAGLKKDDIITEINGKKTENTDDAREQLQEAAEKSSYVIKAKRNGIEMSFNVIIPKKLKTANL